MDEIVVAAIREWIGQKEDMILKDIKEKYDHLSPMEKYTMALGVTYLAEMLTYQGHNEKLKEFEL